MILPKGRKDRAILAALLVSPNMRRSRKWFQALLWGDKPEEKAAANFRQAASRLRKTFETSDGIFGSDRHSLWLDQTRVQIKPSETDLDILFEGLDIRTEAFENWLYDIRNQFSSQHMSALPEPEAPSVALLRPIVTVVSPIGHPQFDRDLARVAHALKNRLALLEIFDLREAHDGSGLREGLVLQARRNSVGAIGVSLAEAGRSRPFWSTALRDRGDFAENAGIVIDAAVEALIGVTSGNLERPLDGAKMLNRMQRLLDGLFIPGSQSVGDLMSDVDDLFKSGAGAIAFALRNCVRMLQFGERKQGFEEMRKEQVLQDLDDSLALSPANALVHALAGHTHSLYLQDPETAIRHSELAVSLAPDSALCRSLLALSHLRAGNPGAALSLSAQALLSGRFSRYRAFMDGAHSAAAACNGEFSMAGNYAERSLEMAPDFFAAQKFLFLSYERAGEVEKAAQLAHKIRKAEPDFGKQLILQSGTSVNISIAKGLIADSASRIGLH